MPRKASDMTDTIESLRAQLATEREYALGLAARVRELEKALLNTCRKQDQGGRDCERCENMALAALVFSAPRFVLRKNSYPYTLTVFQNCPN